MLKVTLLGTGTSGGVPALGCECDVCRSTDPKDKRLRSAAMIETESTRLLIDAGPDIRQQMLRVPFRKIDGLLITLMQQIISVMYFKIHMILLILKELLI